MIRKFDKATALLLVDTQKGVNDTIYYGGKNGRRNNFEAEENIISLLKKACTIPSAKRWLTTLER